MNGLPDQSERDFGGDSLRQAILATLTEIETRLAIDAPSPRDVHLARRAAKRARALARLAPASLAVLARQTQTVVSQGRRLLGGARDADVRRATLASLRRRLGAASAALTPLLDGDEESRPDDVAVIRAEIAALARDWRLCDADCAGGEILDAAAATYRKCRRRLKTAASGDVAALHRWRAAVVEHEYHAAFLAHFAPALATRAKLADRLRAHLGDFNDLEQLEAHVLARAGADHAPEAAKLARVALAQRAKLRQKALALGADMFAQKPARWREELRRAFGR